MKKKQRNETWVLTLHDVIQRKRNDDDRKYDVPLKPGQKRHYQRCVFTGPGLWLEVDTTSIGKRITKYGELRGMQLKVIGKIK